MADKEFMNQICQRGKGSRGGKGASQKSTSAIQTPTAQLQTVSTTPTVPPSKLNCENANGTGLAPVQALAPGTSRLIVQLDNNVAWQPRDGRIRFTVTTTDNTAPSAINGIETAVCFGWPVRVFAAVDTAATERFFAGSYLRTVARTENSITYETGFPDALWATDVKKQLPPTVRDVFWSDFFKKYRGESKHVYDGLGLVPIVHMRVVARSHGVVQTNDPNLLDTVLPVGIAFRIMALGLTFGAVALFWWLLNLWSKRRGTQGGPILRIISNDAGYASLTQFQILLWTLVIGAGLTYVMAITGSLIDVPSQELALLGIAGFSALSAAYAANQAATKQAAQGTPPPAPRAQPPQWSDLVILGDKGGIDITRVQMLVFTVLAAGFVAVKICDESMIPTIPDGIILLMGLSNVVYMGGRFVGNQ